MKKIIKNKKLIILVLLIIILIVAAALLIIRVVNNRTKMLTCKSLDSKMTIEFRKNKAYYVKGEIKLDKESQETAEEKIGMYKEIIKIRDGKLVYAMSYKKENESALNYAGYNLYNDDSYKAMKKYYEDNNYTCK